MNQVTDPDNIVEISSQGIVWNGQDITSNWNFYGPFIHDIRNDDDDDAFRSPNAYYQGGTRETRSYKMLMDILVLKMVFEGWDQIEEKVDYTLNIYEFERKKL